jgi:4-amino-4-deoxy-L-arabinose transferase-like glycosyltransferase
LFGNLGAIGLTGPDEPRYAWIARAMAETGDWVTPRLYGQPWFEKPILYYWAAAVGFLLHLPAEWAARLPSACAALAAALTIGWLARKHYGGDTNSVSSPGLLAPLLFATGVGAIAFARAATPDMLFSAAIAAAMACAANVLGRAGAIRAADRWETTETRSDRAPLLLFGVFLGVAVLAKGPAAIILGGGAIAVWALGTRNWRPAIRMAHPFAIVAFGIVAIPWYALCAARNPDFLRVFIWQHNFERYATPMFQHRQPFWFFGPIVLLALLPWTVLLWPVAQEGLRLWRLKTWTDSPGFFFACWAIWPVAFFTFSQSKLPGYILPAIAPLALLCAVAATRAVSERAARTGALVAGLGIAWIAIGAAAYFSGPRGLTLLLFFGRLPVSPGLFLAAISMLSSLILVAVVVRNGAATAIWTCALLVSASVEIASLKVLPAMDPSVSARPHAEFMRNDQHPERIFTYRLSRSWVYGLTFYFRRELPEWSPTDPEAALVLTTRGGFQEIGALGRFQGLLDEPYEGFLLVPVNRVPRSR